MKFSRIHTIAVTGVLFSATCVDAFLAVHQMSPPEACSKGCRSRIHGVNEWREGLLSSEISSPATNFQAQEQGLNFRLPVHMMDSSSVALQGESVYLQFTKDDELRLFQRAVDIHNGVFALGFVDKAGEGAEDSEEDILYDKVSLVEIEDYNMMGGDFGIFLTARVVGRAMILRTESSGDGDEGDEDDKEPLVALCSEMYNRPEIKSLHEVCEMAEAVEKLIAEVCNAENGSRLLVGDAEDRWDRYRAAYHEALQSDHHGYVCPSPASSTGAAYSWKELNAISWAAFATSDCLKNDKAYRLAALENDFLTNRLLLATYWLSDVLLEAKQAI